MDELNAALAIGAGTVLLLGLAAGYIKNRLWLTQPLIALIVGVVVGALIPGLRPSSGLEEGDSALLREAARITLAISVMGAALRLPHGYAGRHAGGLLVVLGIGMPLMWLAGSLVSYAVLGVPFLVALVVGAVLTPTDPVLSATVVTGKTATAAVPARLRHAITAESGANDGLALIIVMLPVLLLQRPADAALGHWLIDIVLWDVPGAVALGGAIGWLAGRCLAWADRQPVSEQTSILTVALALALTVLAVDRLLGTASVLAVFVAGMAFNHVTSSGEDASQERIQEATGRFFDVPIFILLGVMLPWQGWAEFGWTALPFVLGVLLLRRVPAWLLLRPWLPSIRSWRETLFNGWFGPIGVAALLYASEVGHRIDSGDTVWAAATLVIVASIVAHGITATPLTRAYGRRTTAAERADDEPDPATPR